MIAIQHGEKSYQEDEYLIACVSVYFCGKLDRGLTLILLRSVGVSQNDLEMLHIVPSVLM